jgi:maltose alpha-D-glucosyltransferase/alpha-amylase
MQWSNAPHGGFSTARRVVRPVIDDSVYGYQRVNVAEQRRDPDSLLNWTERVIRARRECPEISWGDYTVVRTNVPEVLVLRFDWRDTALVTLHNFAKQRRRVTLRLEGDGKDALLSIFDDRHSRARPDGTHRISLDPHGWRWFRVGDAENVLERTTLTLSEHEPAGS